MAGELGIVTELRRSSAEAGFDLIQPLQAGWYNGCVDDELRLTDFGSSSNLAVVIGNTRALWPKLLDALRRDPALLAEPHPLEAYAERSIGRAVAALGVTASLRWSHERVRRPVAIQRMAEVAGLAYLSDSHLSVHPVYGPWIALRGAVSFAAPGPCERPLPLRHPCGGCSSHCLPAFARARDATDPCTTDVAALAHWQEWLACRDACPTGRQHRYDDAQIRYHYLKDPEQLRRCVASENPV